MLLICAVQLINSTNYGTLGWEELYIQLVSGWEAAVPFAATSGAEITHATFPTNHLTRVM